MMLPPDPSVNQQVPKGVKMLDPLTKIWMQSKHTISLWRKICSMRQDLAN